MLIDRPVYFTDHVTVGMFRCPTNYPGFRDTGPTERHLIVFPRTGVWIRHAGSRAFVADSRNGEVRRVWSRLSFEVQDREPPGQLGVDLADVVDAAVEAKPDRPGRPRRGERPETVEGHDERPQRGTRL